MNNYMHMTLSDVVTINWNVVQIRIFNMNYISFQKIMQLIILALILDWLYRKRNNWRWAG